MAEITINLHDQPCGNCTVCIGRTIGAKHEQERIIKLLEKHIPIEDNYNMESSCRGCNWEWTWNGKVNDSHEAHLIALIKGDK
jgi:hypothetical protein